MATVVNYRLAVSLSRLLSAPFQFLLLSASE